MMRLDTLPGRFAVARLAADAPFPAWLPVRGFTSVTRTADELSIVCASARVPSQVRAERGWSALRLAGPIPFDQAGVLEALLAPLAAARVPIFAVSTFDTDYVLVKEHDLSRATEALTEAGHEVVPPTWRIEPARDMDAVRALFSEYWREFGFTPCFQGFEAELAGLPGDYAEPRGRLAIAWLGGEAAGSIALREAAGEACEAKRLYVRPAYRGLGLGSALLDWVIEEARDAGYRTLTGDTLPVMSDALALYRRRGFTISQGTGGGGEGPLADARGSAPEVAARFTASPSSFQVCEGIRVSPSETPDSILIGLAL